MSKKKVTEGEAASLCQIHRFDRIVKTFPQFSSYQAQEGGSADLLGLGVPSAAGTNGAVNGAATVTNNIAKFHCKSNGVLYENEILQVLYKV